MAVERCDNDDRARMSKTQVACLIASATLAVSLAWPLTRPSSITMVSRDPIDPPDRVAEGPLSSGDRIREAYHARAVEYPGEIFLRWFKREAVLELWARNPSGRFRLIATYPILASSGEPGPKRREGDRQSPEGFYEIDRFNPQSTYHLSLGLNYPNASDLVLSDREQPGSDIFIHGSNVSIGCAPLGDDAIEEVYLAALDARKYGQSRIQVHIFPARMSGPEWERFATDEIARRPELAAFWAQLQPAFAYFEQHRTLPAINVRKKTGAIS